MEHLWFWVVIILLFIVVIAIIAGNIVVNIAFVPNRDEEVEEREVVVDTTQIEGVEAPSPHIMEKAENEVIKEEKIFKDWLVTLDVDNRREVSIQSFDGLKLLGTVYEQTQKTNKWVVLSHGYQASREENNVYVRHYYKHGYNVLNFDQRASGESEGSYLTMGIKEHKDLLKWIDTVVDKHPNASMVLHGESMGAATILMAAGSGNLHRQVNAIVSDCSYSNVYDVFVNELYNRYKLSPWPLMNLGVFFAKLRFGIDFVEEGNVLDYVQHIDVPTLLIHTSSDDFVLYPMVHEIDENLNINEKEKLIINGATHALAKYAEPETYWSKVYNFVDTYNH